MIYFNVFCVLYVSLLFLVYSATAVKDIESDTELKFEKSGVSDIEDVQSTVKDTIVVRRTSNKIEYAAFSNFLVDVLKTLKTFDDNDLQNFTNIFDAEIRKYYYKGSLFNELADDKTVKKNITDLLEYIKKTPVKSTRTNLDIILKNFQNHEFTKELTDLLNYTDSSYGEESKKKIDDVLKQLKEYIKQNKAKRTRADLVKIVQNGVKSIIFDHYSNLNPNVRKDLRVKVAKYFAENDINKVTTIFFVRVSESTTKPTTTTTTKTTTTTTKTTTTKPTTTKHKLKFLPNPYRIYSDNIPIYKSSREAKAVRKLRKNYLERGIPISSFEHNILLKYYNFRSRNIRDDSEERQRTVGILARRYEYTTTVKKRHETKHNDEKQKNKKREKHYKATDTKEVERTQHQLTTDKKPKLETRQPRHENYIPKQQLVRNHSNLLSQIAIHTDTTHIHNIEEQVHSIRKGMATLNYLDIFVITENSTENISDGETKTKISSILYDMRAHTKKNDGKASKTTTAVKLLQTNSTETIGIIQIPDSSQSSKDKSEGETNTTKNKVLKKFKLKHPQTIINEALNTSSNKSNGSDNQNFSHIESNITGLYENKSKIKNEPLMNFTQYTQLSKSANFTFSDVDKINVVFANGFLAALPKVLTQINKTSTQRDKSYQNNSMYIVISKHSNTSKESESFDKNGRANETIDRVSSHHANELKLKDDVPSKYKKENKSKEKLSSEEFSKPKRDQKSNDKLTFKQDSEHHKDHKATDHELSEEHRTKEETSEEKDFNHRKDHKSTYHRDLKSKDNKPRKEKSNHLKHHRSEETIHTEKEEEISHKDIIAKRDRQKRKKEKISHVNDSEFPIDHNVSKVKTHPKEKNKRPKHYRSEENVQSNKEEDISHKDGAKQSKKQRTKERISHVENAKRPIDYKSKGKKHTEEKIEIKHHGSEENIHSEKEEEISHKDVAMFDKKHKTEEKIVYEVNYKSKGKKRTEEKFEHPPHNRSEESIRFEKEEDISDKDVVLHGKKHKTKEKTFREENSKRPIDYISKGKKLTEETFERLKHHGSEKNIHSEKEEEISHKDATDQKHKIKEKVFHEENSKHPIDYKSKGKKRSEEKSERPTHHGSEQNIRSEKEEGISHKDAAVYDQKHKTKQKVYHEVRPIDYKSKGIKRTEEKFETPQNNRPEKFKHSEMEEEILHKDVAMYDKNQMPREKILSEEDFKRPIDYKSKGKNLREEIIERPKHHGPEENIHYVKEILLKDVAKHLAKETSIVEEHPKRPINFQPKEEIRTEEKSDRPKHHQSEENIHSVKEILQKDVAEYNKKHLAKETSIVEEHLKRPINFKPNEEIRTGEKFDRPKHDGSKENVSLEKVQERLLKESLYKDYAKYSHDHKSKEKISIKNESKRARKRKTKDKMSFRVDSKRSKDPVDVEATKISSKLHKHHSHRHHKRNKSSRHHRRHKSSNYSGHRESSEKSNVEFSEKSHTNQTHLLPYPFGLRKANKHSRRNTDSTNEN